MKVDSSPVLQRERTRRHVFLLREESERWCEKRGRLPSADPPGIPKGSAGGSFQHPQRNKSLAFQRQSRWSQAQSRKKAFWWYLKLCNIRILLYFPFASKLKSVRWGIWNPNDFNTKRTLLRRKASNQHGQLCIPDGKAQGRCLELLLLLLTGRLKAISWRSRVNLIFCLFPLPWAGCSTLSKKAQFPKHPLQNPPFSIYGLNDLSQHLPKVAI